MNTKILKIDGKNMVVKDTTDKICIFTEDGTEWILEVNGKICIDKNFSNPYEAYIYYQKNSFNLKFMEEIIKCIE